MYKSKLKLALLESDPERSHVSNETKKRMHANADVHDKTDRQFQGASIS